MYSATERKLKYHLKEVAKLLKTDAPESELQDFESIELAARKHIVETVGPEIGEFFSAAAEESEAGKRRQVKTCIGQVKVKSSRAKQLGLKPRTQVSPVMEKCCLAASAKSSYQEAEQDIAGSSGSAVISTSFQY